MRSGDLRQRVTIEAQTQRTDGHDGYIQVWSAIGHLSRMPAKVEQLTGQELERARQIDPRAAHRVTVRYWLAYPIELTSRSRVLWHDAVGDRIFEPVQPPIETVPRRTLEVLCREAL